MFHTNQNNSFRLFLPCNDNIITPNVGFSMAMHLVTLGVSNMIYCVYAQGRRQTKTINFFLISKLDYSVIINLRTQNQRMVL